MPAPDTRPTVDFGRRNGASASDRAKAARDLAAGRRRAAAEERASAYREAMAKSRPQPGHGARTRRRRNNPTGARIGPAADQLRDVEY